MSITEYEAKSTGLSQNTPQIISIEKEKAQKFLERLTYYIKSRIVPLMITDYNEALERALVIEETSGKSTLERQQ